MLPTRFNLKKIFGQTFINDDSYLSLIGSVRNVFGVFGIFVMGYLIDRFSFKVNF